MLKGPATFRTKSALHRPSVIVQYDSDYSYLRLSDLEEYSQSLADSLSSSNLRLLHAFILFSS